MEGMAAITMKTCKDFPDIETCLECQDTRSGNCYIRFFYTRLSEYDSLDRLHDDRLIKYHIWFVKAMHIMEENIHEARRLVMVKVLLK